MIIFSNFKFRYFHKLLLRMPGFFYYYYYFLCVYVCAHSPLRLASSEGLHKPSETIPLHQKTPFLHAFPKPSP